MPKPLEAAVMSQTGAIVGVRMRVGKSGTRETSSAFLEGQLREV